MQPPRAINFDLLDGAPAHTFIVLVLLLAASTALGLLAEALFQVTALNAFAVFGTTFVFPAIWISKLITRRAIARTRANTQPPKARTNRVGPEDLTN